jgi:hypothetical protein
MKTVKLWLAAFLLLTVLSSQVMAQTQSAPAKIADPTPSANKMATALSEITGVAISPLLGMGAVGAIKYYRTPPELRDKLPWYANPFFWVPALVLVGLCVFKDAAGATALPTVLKKPFDALETMEHKISGLIAVGAFVPLVATVFQAANDAPSASLSSVGFATIDLHWLYNALAIPIAMIAFVLVWLASNAVNILILLSPFTTVDTALKLFRTSILASVVATSYLNPWFGAVWALLIIIVSYFIGGWSFRLSHFGLSFIRDFFTGRKARFQPDPVENKMFLGRKIQKVPARTYGKLSHNPDGGYNFHYHPWLILPRRTLVLPPGDYEAGRGIFYSEVVRVEGNSARTILLLPPRYLGHEEKLVPIYRLNGTRDVGIRAAWSWIRNLFTGRQVAAPA